jgi:hypothetical protein
MQVYNRSVSTWLIKHLTRLYQKKYCSCAS